MSDVSPIFLLEFVYIEAYVKFISTRALWCIINAAKCMCERKQYQNSKIETSSAPTGKFSKKQELWLFKYFKQFLKVKKKDDEHFQLFQYFMVFFIIRYTSAGIFFRLAGKFLPAGNALRTSALDVEQKSAFS